MRYKMTEFFGVVNPNTGNSTATPKDGSGADMPWIIDDVPEELQKHFISITCYDAENTLKPLSGSLTGDAQITAGTAEVLVSDDGTNYGSITHGSVDLTKASYDRPNMCGRLRTLSVNVRGLTPHNNGATPVIGTVVRVQIHSYA